MKILLVSDLHLTDAPLDAYRFEFLSWLLQKLKELKPDYLFILGDVTHEKDFHSAQFTNKICAWMHTLSDHVKERIIILKGNHDYIQSECPFFKFLDTDRINYVIVPEQISCGEFKFLFLPHTKDWNSYEPWMKNLARYDAVFLHQPIQGAVGENGSEVPRGIPVSSLSEAKVVWAGDIHTPQTIANVTYVGAPYPIRFGDEYLNRVLWWEDGQVDQILVPSIRKSIIKTDDLADLAEDWHEGDQLKIEFSLSRADFHEWPAIRAKIESYCSERGIILCGAKPVEIPVGSSSENSAQTKAGKKSILPADILSSYAAERAIDPRLLATVQKLLTDHARSTAH